MWHSSAWFAGGATNTTHWAAVAEERFAKLVGTYAKKSPGDYVPTFTRALSADLTNGDGTFAVGDNWPRVETDGLICEAVSSESDVEYDFTGVAATSVVATIKLPNEDTAADAIIAELHDGTANESTQCRVDAGADAVELYVADGGAAQGTVTGSTDVSDGSSHTVACSAEADSLKVFVAGASEGTPDTSATIPTTTKLSVCALRTGASQAEGHITELKVYKQAEQTK
jgi:hypothetical protein